MGEHKEAEIDRLPVDLLAHILVLITSFTDLAQASSVCKKWTQAVKQSMGQRETLSFAGWRMDDDTAVRLVGLAYGLKELNISRSRWGCQITDSGLYKISMAKCISNLTSISLWGNTGITDKGVIILVSRAKSLRHLNIGGTFITDESLYAIADSCPHLEKKRSFADEAMMCSVSSLPRQPPKLFMKEPHVKLIKMHSSFHFNAFTNNIILWSCHHVTAKGLVVLVNKCQKLKSINAWGMRVPLDCFLVLLAINPTLQIKPRGLLPNVDTDSLSTLL